MANAERGAEAALGMAGEGSLTIPPKYAERVRLAGLRLLGGDSEDLAREAAKTIKAIEDEAFKRRHPAGDFEPKPLGWLFSDFGGSAAFVGKLIPVVLQLGEDRDSVTGPPETLVYVLDTLIRHVLPGELRCTESPLDGGAGEIAGVLEAMKWGNKEMSRLAGLEARERAQKGGGS